MTDGTISPVVKVRNAENKEKARRQRSTIQFPYNDLDDAVAVAKKMFEKQGSAPCDMDQLAAWLNYESVDSGTFRNKLMAVRYFGLVDVDRQRVTLTSLGEQVVEASREHGARAKAFLNVPLYKKLYDRYRGRQLPPDVALEHEIKSLGVSSKQTDKARQVFRRSAQQAGFFAAAPDRLVQPADISTSPNGGQTGGDKRPSSGGSSGAPPPGLHPKLRLLLSALPPVGESWTEEDKEEWLDLVRNALNAIYPNIAYLELN